MPPEKKDYELSDEAKAEIAAAIAIVREDRFEKYVRERVGGPKSDGNPGDPPPPKTDDAPSDKPKRRGLYWGDSEE